MNEDIKNFRREVKDSVFTYLFGIPEYTRELYLCLHPEDEEFQKHGTDQDIEIVTSENILTDALYNDLGFTVRDRLIFLVEAQSTYSPNIPIRMLMYLAETYRQRLWPQRRQLYSEYPILIPRPEVYVLYTGKKKAPDVFRLSDHFEKGDAESNGRGSSVEICVPVIPVRENGDIVSQYVSFCHISDEQRKKYRNDHRKAAKETIDICIKNNILKKFLESRRMEVEGIMFTLYDQDEISKQYDQYLKDKSRAEGRAEGREAMAIHMHQNGLDIKTIAKVAEVSEEQVQQWIDSAGK